MDSSDLIKKTVNNLLKYIENSKEIPMILPAERVFSAKFEVSRSTLLQAYEDLEKKKIVRQESRSRMALRRPRKEDFFQNMDHVSSKTQNVENYILEKFARLELKPDDKFSELQIAKEINANTVTVREVLLKISSTGLIKKKPRKQWVVISLTSEIVAQINDYRQLLETEGLKCLLLNKKLDKSSEKKYTTLLTRHQSLLTGKNINRKKIIELESDFHKGIISHCNNRFIQDNYESLFFVISYHLGQQNMTQDRFKAVLKEHIEVIKAILESDYSKAVATLKDHFKASKHFFLLSNELERQS